MKIRTKIAIFLLAAVLSLAGYGILADALSARARHGRRPAHDPGVGPHHRLNRSVRVRPASPGPLGPREAGRIDGRLREILQKLFIRRDQGHSECSRQDDEFRIVSRAGG
ncbi:MAG: hypothetical protein MZV70_70495 [Desulfobacterales bacterium]|nr:hypothetical protein [Desulfobacterales bacterium]